MKLFQTSTIIVALLAAIVTIMGASAIQFQYSSISSTPFGFDGYSTMRYTEPGVGSMGFTSTPFGIAGGYSAQGASFGFGYDYQHGMRSVGINHGSVRGSWSRGLDGNAYGGFAAGSNFRHNAFGVNAFGNAWGSNAAYYSPYGTGWGAGYNQYRWM